MFEIDKFESIKEQLIDKIDEENVLRTLAIFKISISIVGLSLLAV